MSQPFRDGFVDGPGGLRLYYRVDGDCGPWLVCANGLGVTIAFWEPFALRMAGQCRVVRFDYRGHGRSDAPHDPASVSIATCADDLGAVLDGLGIEGAVLLGHSMATQVCLEYYRRRPERIAALVPTLGTYRKGLQAFLETRAARGAFGALKKLVGVAPGLLSAAARPVLASGLAERVARRMKLVDPALAPHELMLPFMEQFMRLDLRTYLALAEDMQRYDAGDVLPTVRVPVLAIAAERDTFAPELQVREMASRIPGAEVLVIPNGTHAALIEQPDLLTLRVEKFLEERVFPRDSARLPAV